MFVLEISIDQREQQRGRHDEQLRQHQRRQQPRDPQTPQPHLRPQHAVAAPHRRPHPQKLHADHPQSQVINPSSFFFLPLLASFFFFFYKQRPFGWRWLPPPPPPPPPPLGRGRRLG